MRRDCLGIAGTVVACALFQLPAPRFGWAQTGSGCLKCTDTKMACTGSGANCCCQPHCEWVDTPKPGYLKCSCDEWCKKCGNCMPAECTACFSDNRNRLEPPLVRLASAAPKAALDEVPPAAPIFHYTSAAETALARKSLMAAQALRNLTTSCGTPRVPVALGPINKAPFSGGTSNQVPGKPIEVFEYAGTITVEVGKAILDFQMLDRALEDGGRPTGETLHVEVSEEGRVVVKGVSK